MLHRERLKPPSQDYPPNEWSVIERSFRPEFMAQMETILALGNGTLACAEILKREAHSSKTAPS
jgi:alpha,alpha-trehalose phosphorylase